MGKIAVALALITIWSGCNTSPNSRQRSEAIYAVYSVVVDSICSRPIFIGGRHRNMVIVCDTTRFDTLGSSFEDHAVPINDTNSIEPSQIFTYLTKVLPDLDVLTLKKNLEYENKNPHFIDSELLASKFSCLFLPHSQIEAMLRRGDIGYDSIMSASNGLVHFSRVGFDSALSNAVVHLFHSAYDGGAEYFVVLQKNNGIWVIKKVLTAWYL